MLPTSLRRILIIGPRGVDRTFDLRYAWRNTLGGLDRQRAGEQAIMAAARAVGAVATIMHVNLGGGGDDLSGLAAVTAANGAGQGGGGPRGPRPKGIRIAAGDALDGPVEVALVARAAREALRRPECEDVKFSLAAGRGVDWSDEFLRLVRLEGADPRARLALALAPPLPPQPPILRSAPRFGGAVQPRGWYLSSGCASGHEAYAMRA